MMTALIQLVCSLIVLGTIILIFRIDDARQGARVAAPTRNRFDQLVGFFATRLYRLHVSYGRGVVQLMYHYVAHAILVHTLEWLRSLQHRVERQMRQNRQTARRITRAKTERTHLDDLADHKEATALSEAERERLRSLD